MPCVTMFGCRLRQLATDFTPFYFLTAIVQIIFLFIYWIGVVAFARPETCEPGTQSGGQQWPEVFLLLGLFLFQAAVTVAAVFCSCRGTPLEPSKRRWVVLLSYAYLASIPVNIGLLAWAGWVVEAGDGSCWSSGNKSMPATIVFGAIGVLVGQTVGFLLTYNQLSDVRSSRAWDRVTRTGISGAVHVCGSYGQRHRGPKAQLEEIMTELQHRLASIDGEKSDAATALACASLLQAEAAAAGGGKAGAAGSADAPSEAAAESDALEGSTHASLELLEWAEGVCSGAAAAVAQPAGAPAGEQAAEEALRWACFAAAAYGTRQHMWRRDDTSSCAARMQLSRLASAAAAEGAAPLAGWGGLGPASPDAAPAAAADGPARKPSRSERRSFAPARELLGPGCDIAAMSCGHEGSVLLPHLLALDREQRAVVLGIAGSWQRPHAVPEVVPMPAGWLASSSSSSSAAAEAGGAAMAASKAANGSTAVPVEATAGSKALEGSGASSTGSWVHGESLEAAQALFEELQRSQVLQQLLQPVSSSASGGSSALSGQDCSGWRLVVCGHGVGAGAALLLAPKLAAWQLAPVEVWAFGPPGSLCSADLVPSIACCRPTSVALGDDASPCTTPASVAALVDQCVVGLTRLRYPKMGVLAALVAERLGPKRWQGRWLNPGRALRPLSAVPQEALAYLQSYYAARKGAQLTQPPSCLPGRVLLLFRVQQADAAGAELEAAGKQTAVEGAASGSSKGSNDCKASGSSTEPRWEAAWLEGEELAARGICVSRFSLSDHYVSRLLGVLGDLAPGGTSPTTLDAMNGAA